MAPREPSQKGKITTKHHDKSCWEAGAALTEGSTDVLWAEPGAAVGVSNLKNLSLMVCFTRHLAMVCTRYWKVAMILRKPN